MNCKNSVQLFQTLYILQLEGFLRFIKQIGWRYHPIVSIEERTKRCFKNECTLILYSILFLQEMLWPLLFFFVAIWTWNRLSCKFWLQWWPLTSYASFLICLCFASLSYLMNTRMEWHHTSSPIFFQWLKLPWQVPFFVLFLLDIIFNGNFFPYQGL